jgi:hypothetical protein
MEKANRDNVGKIAFCSNTVLGLKDKNGKNIPGGHYVFIRSVHGKTCDVNVITSLEKKINIYDLKKIRNVSLGNTYPIPLGDANFTKWSGVNHNSIRGVAITDLQDTGKRWIDARHHAYIKKYMK